jgi:hypothetical protein
MQYLKENGCNGRKFLNRNPGARRKGQDIFQVLKEKKCQTPYSISSKLPSGKKMK